MPEQTMRIGDMMYIIERRHRNHSYSTYLHPVAARVISFDEGLVCLVSDGDTYFRRPMDVHAECPKDSVLASWNDDDVTVDSNTREGGHA